MNEDTNNERFDFDAAEQQFEDVEIPTLAPDDIGPAERHIARQIEESFESLEHGLRHALDQVEALREISFEEVMRRPDLIESACAFSNVAPQLVMGLTPIVLATLAARQEFTLDDAADDLPEAA